MFPYYSKKNKQKKKPAEPSGHLDKQASKQNKSPYLPVQTRRWASVCSRSSRGHILSERRFHAPLPAKKSKIWQMSRGMKQKLWHTVSSEYVTDAYLSGTLFLDRCRHNGVTKKSWRQAGAITKAGLISSYSNLSWFKQAWRKAEIGQNML